MNFYSDDIINTIIETSPLDQILQNIDDFKQDTKFLIQLYGRDLIHRTYADYSIKDENVKMAFYCFDNEFNIYNCPVIMLYRKYYDKKKNELIYYILLICTKRKFRNMGYASLLLKNFIEYTKQKNNNKNPDKYNAIKIILSSIEESVLFYENFGFKWKRQESLSDHKILMKHEEYDEKKEYFIMEYIVYPES